MDLETIDGGTDNGGLLWNYFDTVFPHNVSVEKSPGACFSKVPKRFGRISCDIILFVSSKRKRLETRNFSFIIIFIPFTTY